MINKYLYPTKSILFTALPALLVFAIAGCSETKNQTELTVAVSANLQTTFAELAKIYSDSTGKTVSGVVNSSGKLTTQIRNGAPLDLFLSADSLYPAQLHSDGLTAAPPRIYAYGKLIVWFSAPQPPGLSLEFLKSDAVKVIAIANSQTAPYGAAAVTALQAAGIYEQLENKLVFGRNVGQVNQYITSGAADVALTAQSAISGGDVAETNWTAVDPSLYAPIAQAAVIIKNRPRERQMAAAAFLDFLGSPAARQIFQKYGYEVP